MSRREKAFDTEDMTCFQSSPSFHTCGEGSRASYMAIQTEACCLDSHIVYTIMKENHDLWFIQSRLMRLPTVRSFSISAAHCSTKTC